MSEQITSAAERVRAYLDEMDRIDAIRPQYADEVHGINDYVLARSDVRAVLDHPQRVQPSREGVADLLIQARSSGMCRFGKVCNLCDCGLEGHTDDEARRADSRTLIEADAVLALFADRPTVAEVKAEALREAADDYTYSYGGRGATKMRPAARRWLRDRADRIEREARS